MAQQGRLLVQHVQVIEAEFRRGLAQDIDVIGWTDLVELFQHGRFTPPFFPPFSISSGESIAMAAIFAILYTPLFAWVLSLTGYVSDKRRIDFGRATGTALVTLVALVVWSLFVLEHAPREHG